MGTRRNSDLGSVLNRQPLLLQLVVGKFLPLCLVATNVVCGELQLRQEVGDTFEEWESEY
jgi:hypothetical protein